MDTNVFIKGLIFRALKTRFQGFENMLIFVKDKKAIIKTANGVREIPTSETEQKNFDMLAESKGMKEITQIYADAGKDVIVLRGDIDVTF